MFSYKYKALRWLNRTFATGALAWVAYWGMQSPARWFIAFLGPLAFYVLYRVIRSLLGQVEDEL